MHKNYLASLNVFRISGAVVFAGLVSMTPAMHAQNLPDAQIEANVLPSACERSAARNAVDQNDNRLRHGDVERKRFR